MNDMELFRAVFENPWKENQYKEVLASSYKPTYEGWLEILKKYDVFSGYTDPDGYNPLGDYFSELGIDISCTEFAAPIKDFSFVKIIYSNKWGKRLTNKHKAIVKSRAERLLITVVNIYNSVVANPVTMFTGTNRKVFIHPHRTLVSAHSLLDIPLKIILYVKKNNFVGPVVNISNSKQLFSLTDICNEFESIPIGFLQYIPNIQMWCAPKNYHLRDKNGWPGYNKFDQYRCNEIIKDKTDIIPLLDQIKQECYV